MRQPHECTWPYSPRQTKVQGYEMCWLVTHVTKIWGLLLLRIPRVTYLVALWRNEQASPNWKGASRSICHADPTLIVCPDIMIIFENDDLVLQSDQRIHHGNRVRRSHTLSQHASICKLSSIWIHCEKSLDGQGVIPPTQPSSKLV